MRAKQLGSIVALGCGCIALIWGLAHLHSIFLDERRDALDAVTARQRALAQYAQQELTVRLQQRLAQSRARITAALDDPLRSAKDLVLLEGGQQRLPPITRAAVRDGGFANRVSACLYAKCETTGARVPWPTDGPFAERLAVFRSIDDALARADRPTIEQQVRQMLRLRSLYVIDTRLELPLTLAMLERLTAAARPDRKLMQILLRDGYRSDGAGFEGLQRMLLARRDRFGEAEFASFAQKIIELSEPAGVAFVDFQARVAERYAKLELPPQLDAPTLAREPGGLWFLVPESGARIVGLRFDLPAMVSEVAAAMRSRKLIEAGDALGFNLAAGVTRLDAVAPRVHSPRWSRLTQAAEARYRLKSALEFVVALLSLGVVALSVLLYRRRNRFLALKSEFVSAVSHELRTPLASIRLMAETLERRTKGVEGARDYPTRIVRDVEGLSFLVENILSFDRLQRGRWVPKRQPVMLAQIIDKLDRERDTWARRPAEIERQDLNVTLDADPDLLLLLLTNLARNACQYTSREPATIHISAEPSGHRVVIRVRDNGVGIAEAERGRVFDDFFRAADRTGRGERGSGLGLSICRKIVEAHGGVLRVADTGPEGTTFEMSFASAAAIDDAEASSP
jgi:signal transduction histidine kinase